MDILDDDRAQAIQVGAVLIFGFIVVFLAMYQAQVVPNENKQVEAQHSDTVQNQLIDLRNTILQGAATGESYPVSISIGTGYPPRIFAVNPPPSSGDLHTNDSGQIHVENVTALDSETDDFLNQSLSLPTKSIVYEPDYNEYLNSPTRVFEHSLLYNIFPEGSTSTTAQAIVRDKTITLVTINGSLSERGIDPTTIDPSVLSGPYNPIQVTNSSVGNLTITFESRRDATYWRTETSLGTQPFVTVDQAGPNQIRLILDGGVTYTLQTAKIGVGTDTTNPGSAYITRVGSGTVNAGESVTFEVRDKYNNPVAGATVTVTGPAVRSASEKTSGTDGRVTYEFTDTGNASIHLPTNASEQERVTFEVEESTGSESGFSIEWVSGPNCNADTSVCDLNTSDGPSATFIAQVTRDGTPVSSTQVDFGYNNSTLVSSINPDITQTNNTGQAAVTVDVTQTEGVLELFAASGGSADSLELNISVPEDGEFYPSVTITDVEESGGSGNVDVHYSANANGDGDLMEVSVTAVPEGGGEEVTNSETVSGETASGSLRLNLDSNTNYTITVTITDSTGRTSSDSWNYE